VLTPTYALDIARQIVLLVEQQVPGMLHGTAQGACSWYDFAAEIFRANRTLGKLKRAAPEDFPAKVPRPKYSVLENAKLKEAGIDRMPEWQSGLRRYLGELGL
jgi:dTDP-4-dehydrorhamnose reductase